MVMPEEDYWSVLNTVYSIPEDYHSVIETWEIKFPAKYVLKI